jgi:pimeloyl-ACP methyl ester carboxylesterase
MLSTRPSLVLFFCICFPFALGSHSSAEEASIQLEITTGKLDGTLDLPAGAGPFPVVVIIAGSGGTDRDGNQRLLQNDCLKLLGQSLAGKGIAALRYDKRGIGKSTAAMTKEEDLRFDMYAEDVVGWIKLLRSDRRFSKVGIVGHSEGSLIGMLAARKAKADAFVSIAGAGRSAPVVLREQLAKKLSEELKKKSDHIIDELVAGRTVADTPMVLAALFRPSVQPYLISYFKYDPARELAELKMPVLIVQGTTDIQISVEDAKLLAAAKKDAKLVVIDGMNHVFRKAKTPDEQQKAYYERTLPLMPEFVEEVAGFLGKALAKP